MVGASHNQMQLSLFGAGRKIAFVTVCVAAAALYVGSAATSFLAAFFSSRPDLTSLEQAVRLEPGNAANHYRLARYLWLVQQSPEDAEPPYRAALSLNPHVARYWLELAAVYQRMGKPDDQGVAIDRAIQAEPTTPDVAWEAANLYLVRAENEQALREFRVVLANSPDQSLPALRFCWRIKPDVDALLRDVLPREVSVYSTFLEMLTSRNETVAAERVWNELVSLRQPVRTRYLFPYISYLLSQHEVDQARRAWRQAANLCNLGSYQPSPANLVVNGDFSLDVLNGGFDWLYRKSRDIALALDPTQSHGGHRSLLIAFDSRAVTDAGIRQIIPVSPSTAYDFSAYFRSQGMEGVGGPRFVIQDLYTQNTFFAGEELIDVDFWKQAQGTFTTAADTKAVVLRVQRWPEGKPLKGKLWIDDFRLMAAKPRE